MGLHVGLQVGQQAFASELLRSGVGLYKIISTVVSAVPQMLNVLLLMFLICTIFALLGMQLFGGQFSEEHG